MSEIRFGTDGWRAVIAQDYTFENVRLVADAIAVAAHTFEAPEGVDRGKLIVGYDRRFLSRDFAWEAAMTLSRAGFDVLISKEPCPSPAVSFAVASRRVLGGVVITASHNPASYNGIKWKGWYGGSGLPEMYSKIADSLGQQDRRGGGSVLDVDLLDDYVGAIRDRVDVDAIRSAKLKIVHDPMHGAASGLLERIVGVSSATSRGGSHLVHGREREWPMVRVLRGEDNPGFGGVNPEPIPENLELTRDFMRKNEYDFAICNDGDSDRLGIIDEKGDFVSPHKILSLLTLYLIRSKGLRGEVVKTFSTTRLIEKIAKGLAVPLHETSIGFKYVADLMLTRDILLGGEESGGIGFGSFLPERDGLLSGLLVAEAVAESHKPLSVIVREMEEEFGTLHYGRRDVRHSMEACERLIERARSGELNGHFGSSFSAIEEKDGVKINYHDGSWILFRKSGTEPIIRIYAESPNPNDVGRMLDVAVSELSG
jgi:phosphomannomutase